MRLDLMLDSGAFTAWRLGKVINVKDYIKFVKARLPLLHSYVSLDTIPGVCGQRITQHDVNQSAKASYRNHQIMKNAGLAPIPVFHKGESFHWLERYLKDGDPIIGISPPAKIPTKRVLPWLDHVFGMITDTTGRPTVATHGFGITQPVVLMRYPWTTADSTTWTVLAGYGAIIVPGFVNGQPDYTRPHRVIGVTGKHAVSSPSRLQYSNLGPVMQAHVDKFLDQEVGCTAGHVRYSNYWRRKAILKYYAGLELAVRQQGHRRFHGDLFSQPLLRRGRLHAPPTLPPFRMIMATMPDMNKNSVLTEMLMSSRLLSYYLTADLPIDELAYLVKHGQPKPTGRSSPRRGRAYANLEAIAVIERARYLEADDAD